MRKLIAALLTLTVVGGISSARTWTNTSGATFEGELSKKDGDTVYIIRASDQKEIPVAMNVLSEKDREFIAAAGSGTKEEPRTLMKVLPEELQAKVVAWYPFGSESKITFDPVRNTSKSKAVQLGWSKQGITDGCATFNGRATRMPIGKPATLRGSSFTISLWVRTAAQGPQTVFSWGADRRGAAIYTERSAVTCAYRWKMGAKGVEEIRASKANVNDFKWHHICLSVSHEGSMTLWFDGAEAGSSKHFELANENPKSQTTLGDKSDRHVLFDPDLTPFSGSIDEVMIFKSALHQSEIEQLYQAPKNLK